MQIELSHFSQGPKLSEKVRYLKLLDQFDKLLFSVLCKELISGNQITNVRLNKTDAGVVVSLKKSFRTRHESADLRFESESDPHFGGEVYLNVKNPKDSLTAPFKDRQEV